MGDGIVRRRILVDGQVQGVFFRDSCRREAVRAGVAGFVRNLGDGRVEVIAEGHPDAVARLVAWCRVGPPHAEVTGIDISSETPSGLVGFAIR